MDIKITDVRCRKADAAFLIDDGKTSILYDTGFGFTGYAVAENIKEYLQERTLDYIFLTHSHYDHALGSAYVLRYYPTAKVVAGSHAAEVFKRAGAIKVMKELDAKYAEICGVTNYEFLGNELKVDIIVDDGDVIHAGDMVFEAIRLPGHTRCCIGYYCANEGLFLSNETLGVYDGDKTILAVCLVSYADTINSIERIEKLNITSVLSPHYGLLNKTQTKFFLKNMKIATQNIADYIVTNLKKGLSDEDVVSLFIEKYCRRYIDEIYPEDAAKLNTSLMVHLLKNELLNNKPDSLK